MEKILITGGAGQLGREVAGQLGSLALPLARAEFDLLDADAMERALAEHEPTAVWNCAAYTQVDRAEDEQELCRSINADGVEALARLCARHDVSMLHISTDYVFGAPRPATPRPWEVDDPVAPQGVYAQTKREGEERALAANPRACVVRSCGLYDAVRVEGTSNFVKTMLRLGRERDELGVVDDQECTPTYVRDLVPALVALHQAEASGVFQVTNGGSTTWWGFAHKLFELAEIEVELRAITTADFGAPAPRPAYSVMSNQRYEEIGPALRSWQAALAAALADPAVPSS